MVEMFQSEQCKVNLKLRRRRVHIQAQYVLNVAAIASIITSSNYQVSLIIFPV